MSEVLIRKALEKRLNGMTPALATAWENASFTPVTGTPYQRVNLLPATPDNPTIGGNYYLAQGIFQVTLCYPKGGGPSLSAARAEMVKSRFQRALSMTESGVTVTITRTPAIMPAFIDDDRYCIPISIRYHAHINS